MIESCHFLTRCAPFEKHLSGLAEVQVGGGEGGGGFTPGKIGWGGGGVRLHPKTHTLFLTKTCDIPHPMYDPTVNSKPFLRPNP